MAQNPMLSLVYIGTYLRKIKFDSDENLHVSTHKMVSILLLSLGIISVN